LHIPTEAESIIGLDLGGTKLLGILMTRSARIVTRLQVPTPRGNAAVTSAVISLLEMMVKEAAGINIRPTGIAIGSPGFIDPASEMIVDAENLEVSHLALSKAVTDHFGLPAHLFHDVKAAVLGEALFGAGIGRDDFAFLNIGTGVSVGLYLDGRVYRGAGNKSGEIGHIALGPAGAGKTVEPWNRLESKASGPALVRRALDELSRSPESHILELAGNNPERVSPQVIHEAAAAGDLLAVRLIEETADILGAAVGAVLDILDLECVILGGGVAQMGTLLLDPIERAVARYAISPVPVLVSPLGGDAGAVGVVASFFYTGGRP